VVPAFIGGVALAWIADRLPRRRVMIGADLASGALVAVMAVPGLPLAALVVLLAAVTMVGAVFLAARAATYPEILPGDRYLLGTAVTMTTLQLAQVVGFAAGGAAVALLGVRVSLLADAATFAASALLTRAWVRARPAGPPGPSRRPGAGPVAGMAAGVRLVFSTPALRAPMLLGWLCAFYDVPEGVAAPLAGAVGGGAVTVGLILAAQALGTVAGAIGFSRLVDPVRRQQWAAPLAVAACAALALFALGPGLPGALLILALSGLLGCYQLAVNAAFVQATPPAQRSQAFGVAQGGISLGQGGAIIAAGAAAGRIGPAAVITVAGSLGALCALAVALSAPARRSRPRPAAAPPPPARRA
jgi:predicted MFS family arabinose efflux permease